MFTFSHPEVLAAMVNERAKVLIEEADRHRLAASIGRTRHRWRRRH